MALKEFLDLDGLNYYQDVKVQPELDKLSSINHTHTGIPSSAEKKNITALKNISVRGTLVAGDEELVLTSPYFKKDGLVTVYTSDFKRVPISVVVSDGKVVLTFKKSDSDLDIAVVVRSSQYQFGKLLSDTIDADATSEDILKGKTAVVDNVLITGTLESYETSHFIPTTTDQVIKAGKYISPGFIVQGDSDLKSENIANGVNLFDVIGSYTGYTVKINGEVYASPISDGEFNITTDSSGKIYIDG